MIKRERLKSFLISNSLPIDQSFLNLQKIPLTKEPYYFSMRIEIVILAT